jgi:chromosomal replication initiator protein
LRKKADSLQVSLPTHVLEYLAHRIKSNVRRLEGALLRVASFASLSGRPLSDESIEHLLRDILQEEARRAVNVDQVQRKVAEHYDVRLADMTSKRRPAHIAFPRQVAMFISRRLTKCSLQDIGEAFGGKDHGTVIHACKTVQNRMDKEESLRQVVRFLEASLQR